MKAVNIIWDTDGGKELEKALPKEVTLPDGMGGDEDAVSEYLSSLTGFCHNGFLLEGGDLPKEIPFVELDKAKLPSGTKMLAIDSSTKKTALAFYVDGKCRNYTIIDFDDIKDMELRFTKMAESLWAAMDAYATDILYMEETAVTRNGSTQRFLTRLSGIVYAWCMRHGCEFNTVRPTVWRKQLSFSQGKGVGRAELKAQSIAYVKAVYGLEVSDDIADAICIGDAVIKMFKSLEEKAERGKVPCQTS